MKGRSNKDEGQSKTAIRQGGVGLVLTTLSLIIGTCLGSVWTTDGTDSLLAQLDRIEFENVSIHHAGTVTLAPALTPTTLDDAAAVWQTAADRNGNVYAATGNQGRLYRIGRAGTPERVFDSGTGEILALTVDASGTVYFGTTPDGKVYRIRPGGKPEPVSYTHLTLPTILRV